MSLSTRFESVVCEGHLLKRGANVKTWKKRLFVLDTRGLLQYYKEKGKSRSLLDVIDLTEVTNIRETSTDAWATKNVFPPPSMVPSKANCFELETPRRTYYLIALDPDIPWTDKLREIRTHARQQRRTTIDGSEAHNVDKSLLDTALHFGWITKMGGRVRNWRRRFFLLTAQGLLLYAKDQSSLDQALGSLHVRHIQEIRPPEECNWAQSTRPKNTAADACFEIVTAKRNFWLVCDTPEEARTWVNQLEGACLFYSLSFNVTSPVQDEDGNDSDERMSTMSSASARSSRAASRATLDSTATDDDDDGSTDGLTDDLRHMVEDELKEHEETDVIFRAQKSTLTKAARLAMRQSRMSLAGPSGHRRIIVLYNPVSGAGQGRLIAEHHVAPILRLAKIDFEILPTEYAGHATHYVANLDLGRIDGLAVCGGDGLVSEVMTGLLNRMDGRAASFPIGIIPVGTANAMAHALDSDVSATECDLISRAALAIAKGTTRKVDVLDIHMRRKRSMITHLSKTVTAPPTDSNDDDEEEEAEEAEEEMEESLDMTGTPEHVSDSTEANGRTSDEGGVGELPRPTSPTSSTSASTAEEMKAVGGQDEDGARTPRPEDAEMDEYCPDSTYPGTNEHVYGLSCIGWGLTGACTARAQHLRWMPGQKKIRYDVAGFLTLLRDWPLVCKCKFEWRDPKTDEWHREDVGIVNMIGANMDKLGVAHAICRGIEPDDGTIGLTMINDKHSRAGTVAAAMSLKKGKYLSDHKNVRTVITSEFKMTPHPGSKAERIPFNIDGDPVDPAAIHVKVLPQRMRVFAHPE